MRIFDRIHALRGKQVRLVLSSGIHVSGQVADHIGSDHVGI